MKNDIFYHFKQIIRNVKHRLLRCVAPEARPKVHQAELELQDEVEPIVEACFQRQPISLVAHMQHLIESGVINKGLLVQVCIYHARQVDLPT